MNWLIEKTSQEMTIQQEIHSNIVGIFDGDNISKLKTEKEPFVKQNQKKKEILTKRAFNNNNKMKKMINLCT